MREPKRETIGEFVYSVTPMSPMKSTKILSRLLKIAGGPLGKLMDAKKGEGSILDADVNGGLIGEALESLTEVLDENELEAIITALLNKDFVTYSKVGEESFQKLNNIDLHFSEAGLSSMFKVLKFVLEVNYKDFLADLVG